MTTNRKLRVAHRRSFRAVSEPRRKVERSRPWTVAPFAGVLWHEDMKMIEAAMHPIRIQFASNSHPFRLAGSCGRPLLWIRKRRGKGGRQMHAGNVGPVTRDTAGRSRRTERGQRRRNRERARPNRSIGGLYVRPCVTAECVRSQVSTSVNTSTRDENVQWCGGCCRMNHILGRYGPN